MAPVIETARMILRGWNECDVEAWIAMNADPDVVRYFPGPYTREVSEDQAARMRRRLERDGYGWWIVELKESREFAGVIALQDVDYFPAEFTPKREVGWRFRSDMWGRGYATEGADGALRFARDVLGWDSIVAFTAVQNLRSQRVMERLGMTHDPRDDFDHPRIEESHPLRRHVLYRKDLR